MNKILLIFIAFVFSACATERFGRMQRLTPGEEKYLTCEAIEVEIEKSQSFIVHTKAESDKFKGTDFLAFLGDFGIGNEMELADAIKSAQDRTLDLRILQSKKGCVVSK